MTELKIVSDHIDIDYSVTMEVINISQFGLLTIKSSEELIIADLTGLDKKFLDMKIIPSEDAYTSVLDFDWKIVN